MRLLRDRGGNFALMFALLTPVVFGLAGGAVDLVIYQRQHGQMQDAADAAALAAVQEASLKGWNAVQAQSVVDGMVSGNLQGKTFSATTKFTTSVAVDEVNRTVRVTLDMDEYSFFVLSYFRHNPQIRVSAAATSTNAANVCVIGLNESAPATIKLSGTAKLNAGACAVFSNSEATDGLTSLDSSYLTAQMACTAGGYVGKSSNFSLAPTIDCPGLPDPLSARIAPKPGACDFTNLVITKQIITLKPGTYCGGIFVDQLSLVTFSPGIYIIKDGLLKTTNSAYIKGVGVAFVFSGAGSRFTFDGTTVVDFTAPSAGPMAGMLFFQDPAGSVPGTVFEIYSKIASNLLGTIYLPNATLSVKAANKIAEKSAYTVIVAKNIEIGDKTDMYINANYSATTVPVPAGLGPSSGKVRLLEGT